MSLLVRGCCVVSSVRNTMPLCVTLFLVISYARLPRLKTLMSEI